MSHLEAAGVHKSDTVDGVGLVNSTRTDAT